jgi:hypothetical protein
MWLLAAARGDLSRLAGLASFAWGLAGPGPVSWLCDLLA